MKFTRSKDGIDRTTIRVDYRISDDDREWIAYVADRIDGKDDPQLRFASRKEIVEAIKSFGYPHDMDWGEEYQDEYEAAKSSQRRLLK